MSEKGFHEMAYDYALFITLNWLVYNRSKSYFTKKICSHIVDSDKI